MNMSDRNAWEGERGMSHQARQNKAEGTELGADLKIFRNVFFIISVYDERMEVCHFRILDASSLMF